MASLSHQSPVTGSTGLAISGSQAEHQAAEIAGLTLKWFIIKYSFSQMSEKCRVDCRRGHEC